MQDLMENLQMESRIVTLITVSQQHPIRKITGERFEGLGPDLDRGFVEWISTRQRRFFNIFCHKTPCSTGTEVWKLQ